MEDIKQDLKDLSLPMAIFALIVAFSVFMAWMGL